MTHTYCCVYSTKLLMMDGKPSRNAEFDSKNKFEKLVHLVGFIIRIYHAAQSCECQMFIPIFLHTKNQFYNEVIDFF